MVQRLKKARQLLQTLVSRGAGHCKLSRPEITNEVYQYDPKALFLKQLQLQSLLKPTPAPLRRSPIPGLSRQVLRQHPAGHFPMCLFGKPDFAKQAVLSRGGKSIVTAHCLPFLPTRLPVFANRQARSIRPPPRHKLTTAFYANRQEGRATIIPGFSGAGSAWNMACRLVGPSEICL